MNINDPDKGLSENVVFETCFQLISHVHSIHGKASIWQQWRHRSNYGVVWFGSTKGNGEMHLYQVIG